MRSDTFRELIHVLNFASNLICQMQQNSGPLHRNHIFSSWHLFSGSSVTIGGWTYCHLLKLMLLFPNPNLILSLSFPFLPPSYVPSFCRHSPGPTAHISQVPPDKIWCWPQGQRPTSASESLVCTPRLFIYLSSRHLLPDALSAGYTHLSSVRFFTYLRSTLPDLTTMQR